MQITRIESFTVAIPFFAPILSAFGASYPARIRTFIRIYTDAGYIGHGETGPSAVHYVKREALIGRFEKLISPNILGESPFHYEYIKRKLYQTPAEAIAIEIACWDIMAQAAGVPLYQLLNGAGFCESVPLAAYCFYRAPNQDGDGAVTPENMVGHCQTLMSQYGFKTLKIKLGANAPFIDVEVIRQLREAVGSGINIRIDPNGSYSLPTALRMTKALEAVDLQYIEEPVRAAGPADGTIASASLKRLRGSTLTPIAADHVYRIDLLAEVIRADCADLVLPDLYGCGGIAGTVRYIQTASAFGLGMALHSGTETDVGQVAKLHIHAAYRDQLGFDADAIYPEYTDSVLVDGKLKIQDGQMDVPQGTGLGITFDEAKLAQLELTAEKHRELDEFWDETKAEYGIGLPSASLLVHQY